MEPVLIISEVFKSIQGETSHAGRPCVFVRTAGCNLRCDYCDTPYAQSREGAALSVPQVRAKVDSFRLNLACITGGEPMLQAEGVVALAGALLAGGHTVLLETNGTVDLSPVPPAVLRIVDVKCPGSSESGQTLPENLQAIRPRDEVKFVISDRRDFDWAEAFVEQYWPGRQRLDQKGPQVLFAPAEGRLTGRELAEWILEADLEVRLQLQLHKMIWPERTRGA